MTHPKQEEKSYNFSHTKKKDMIGTTTTPRSKLEIVYRLNYTPPTNTPSSKKSTYFLDLRNMWLGRL